MKVLVIYNPASGGSREKTLQRLVSALQARGADVEIYRTKGPGDATQYLQARAQQGGVVIAMGGDGTANEVINGLPPSVPLAVMATGTANVLARELSLPRRPEQVAELVMTGKPMNIWPGRQNGKRFLMWVGIGYDAWVVHATNLALKQRIGKGAYIAAMLSQVARYGSCRYQLSVDGEEMDCYSAIIANARYYGGNFILSRQANIAAPTLQVLLFRKPGRWILIKSLLALLVGKMERIEGVESITAQQITLHSPANEPLQADGDPAGVLPVEICVDDTPLSVMVPLATHRLFARS